MVEEVPCSGAEIVSIEDPAVDGDCNTKLMLLVALAFERQKPKTLCSRQLQERAGKREQRRRLIVASVKTAQHPVQARHSDCRSHPGVGGVFREWARKVGEPQPGIEGQPGGGLELFFGKQRLKGSVRRLALLENRTAAVVCGEPEEFAVALGESINPCPEIVPPPDVGDGPLPPGIVGSSVVGGTGHIERSAHVCGAVEMIEGRDGEQGVGAESVNPREDSEGILLVLPVAYAGGLLTGGVWHLIVVGAGSADEAQLVGGVRVENQRRESAASAVHIVQDVRRRGFKPEVTAVAVQTGVVGKAGGVVANAQLVIGEIVRSVAEDQFALPVALKSRPRFDVENAVGAVAVIG